MRTAVVLAALLLAACAAPQQPRTETVEVKVPVPVSCLPDTLPEQPKLKAPQELKAMGDYDLVLEIEAERIELAAYAEQLEAILTACR